MPQTLEALRRRIGVVTELESVVNTMKALSAATIRQYENAVEALGDYYRTVELGLYVVLREGPLTDSRARQAAAHKPTAAIIIGSDQGLCGRFNELIADRALQTLADMPSHSLKILALGARLAEQLEDRNQSVEKSLMVPGSVAAISTSVDQILLQIDTWQTRQDVSAILLFHNRPTAQATYQPDRIDLLPFDFSRFRQIDKNTKSWPSRALPTFTMERRDLLTALLRQYFFVILFRACAESLVCEHSARLAAMQRASKNIEEHLGVLNAHYRQQRQTSITEELLDIVVGYEALTESDTAKS